MCCSRVDEKAPPAGASRAFVRYTESSYGKVPVLLIIFNKSATADPTQQFVRKALFVRALNQLVWRAWTRFHSLSILPERTY
jgi:hypothetical protein